MKTPGVRCRSRALGAEGRFRLAQQQENYCDFGHSLYRRFAVFALVRIAMRTNRASRMSLYVYVSSVFRPNLRRHAPQRFTATPTRASGKRNESCCGGSGACRVPRWCLHTAAYAGAARAAMGVPSPPLIAAFAAPARGASGWGVGSGRAVRVACGPARLRFLCRHFVARQTSASMPCTCRC